MRRNIADHAFNFRQRSFRSEICGIEATKKISQLAETNGGVIYEARVEQGFCRRWHRTLQKVDVNACVEQDLRTADGLLADIICYALENASFDRSLRIYAP